MRTFAVVLWLVLLAQTVQSAPVVVYLQPHDGSAGFYQSSWWDPDGSDYDQLTWDSFRLTNASAITEVRWRGAFDPSHFGWGGPVIDFTVAIYGDIANGYQPDIISPPLASYRTGGNAGQTSAGTFGGVAMYDYSFVLPSPFQAASNACYWVLIEAWQHGIPDWGFALGTGGSGSCFRRTAGVGDFRYYLADGDVAFTLLTADVPTFSIAASVSPIGAGTVIGAGNYPSNSTAALTAAPNAGWGFAKWTENGAQASSASTYNFTVRSNRTLVANFTPAYTITTSASPGHGGLTSGGGIFNSNTAVTVTATPAVGYSFVRWTEFGTPVSTSSNYTFNARSHRTLVADFAAAPSTATFDFDTGTPPVGQGQGLPASQLNNGLTAYFSTLSGGWFVYDNFYGWVPSNFSGYFLYPTTWGSTMSIEFSEPITNISLQYFTGDVASEYDMATTMRIEACTNAALTGAVATVTAQGTWVSGAYPQGSMKLGSTTPFTNVKIDMPPGQGLVSYIYWVDNIVVERAVVQPTIAITTSASPIDGGTTSGDGIYSVGSNVTVVATPAAGYTFVDWTENSTQVSASASYSFSASANRALVAHFAIPSFTVSASASPIEGGTITGDGVYLLGAWAGLTATPNPGYAFIDWTENGTPVCTWSGYGWPVESNRILVANFAATVSITTSASSTNGLTGGDGVFAIGTMVGVVATPKSGATFVNWTENGLLVSSSPSYIFTASSDCALVANFAPDSTGVTFDFDTATPPLTNAQTLPFDQISHGVTASFRSSAGPALLVQCGAVSGWVMSKFSGNYLCPNISGSGLEIQFSQPVSSIALTFATFDWQEILTPSLLQLEAFLDTTNTPIGTATTNGTINYSDTAPVSGQIHFRSTTPFNLVRLTVPPAPISATDFLVDNVTVTMLPALQVQATGGGVIVSWPLTETYLLQMNTDLNSTNWVNVTDGIAVVNGRKNFTASVAGATFFRLMQP